MGYNTDSTVGDQKTWNDDITGFEGSYIVQLCWSCMEFSQIVRGACISADIKRADDKKSRAIADPACAEPSHERIINSQLPSKPFLQQTLASYGSSRLDFATLHVSGPRGLSFELPGQMSGLFTNTSKSLSEEDNVNFYIAGDMLSRVGSHRFVARFYRDGTQPQYIDSIFDFRPQF